jgi:hypothetical protein
MKYVTLHIGESVVEIYNSLFGKEMVIVDGNKVSEKYSIVGTDHRFTIRDGGQEKHVQLNTKLTVNGAIFDLYVDNKPVIEVPDNSGQFIMLLVFAFAIIAILGWLF